MRKSCLEVNAENNDKKLKAVIRKLRLTLSKVHKRTFHYPDSDAQQHCTGCGRSPHNSPPHQPGCLVVEVCKVLEGTKEFK